MLATAATAGTCNVGGDYASMCGGIGGSGFGFGGLGLDAFGFHHYRGDGSGGGSSNGNGALLSMYGCGGASTPAAGVEPSRLHHEFAPSSSSVGAECRGVNGGNVLTHRQHQQVDGRGCGGSTTSASSSSSALNSSDAHLQLQEPRGNCSPPLSSTTSYARPHQFGAELQQQQQQLGVRVHRNGLVGGTNTTATVDPADLSQYDVASTAATSLRSHCYNGRQQHPAATAATIYYGSPCDPTAGGGLVPSCSSAGSASVDAVPCCDGADMNGGSVATMGASTGAHYSYGARQPSSTIVPGHPMSRNVSGTGSSCAFAAGTGGYCNGTSSAVPHMLMSSSSSSSCSRCPAVGDSPSSLFDGSRGVGAGAAMLGCGGVEQLHCRLQQQQQHQQQQQQMQSATTGTYKWMTIKRNTPKTTNQQQCMYNCLNS